ncbi:MAG TPA: efflux RND transporter permease subunit [Candidatus Hydrogenedentes bacterium]|nr:efflux RND transporter permease subunit [Candidatus Hydrogenedentota bacterium]
MRGLLAAFARNRVFANMFIAIIYLAGFFAMMKMVRETLPEMEVDLITVGVAWPGADPEEVEEGICRKIEEAIESIQGIKQYSTVAQENLGYAYIEVNERYDLATVKDHVRNAVEAISTFPKDAERPITEAPTFKAHVLFVALFGESLRERELKEWAERMMEEIRALPPVSQVEVLGAREYEIAIELSEERLREYGLTFEQVALAVRASNLNLSGGLMRTEGEEIRLRTLGRKYSTDEFARIIVYARPNGDVITLDRIATIKDDFTEDYVISRYNGKPCLTLMVMKTEEEDTLAIDEAVSAYVAQKKLPEGVHAEIWGAMADELQARINLLVRNGLFGLSLVFLMLWLFLDIRLSFWVAQGMPFCLFGGMALIWFMGSTLNMISLFAMIMALGMLVDDAIVVGEAIYQHRRNGEPPLQAAINGVMEVALPVLAAVTTTIVAFIPLCFVSGVMGRLIVILPIVVISALSISLIECLLCIPAHLNHLPDLNRPDLGRNVMARFGRRFHKAVDDGVYWFIYHAYAPFARLAIRWRYVSLAVGIAVLLSAGGILASGVLKFQFFPKIDGNEMVARIEFPTGTPLPVTKEAVAKVEEAIRRVEEKTTTVSGKPLIVNTFSLAGSTMSVEGSARGSHRGAVRVEMLPSLERGIHTEDLKAAWEKEVGLIPGIKSLVFRGGIEGPPGAPIEIWLHGPDLDAIQKAAHETIDKLRTYAGVYQIEDDFSPSKNEIKLRLRPDARALGLTEADLARQIYGGYFGEEAVRLQRGRDDIRVRVRYPAEDRTRVSELERIRIRTPLGFEAPLLSVADISYGPGPTFIKRTDGERRVKVTADVNVTVANSSEVIADLGEAFIPALQKKYPGTSVSFEGEQRNMRESFDSLYVSYPLALLGIFILIASTFRSYLQPLVIMVIIPFGTIGALLGHLAMGYDLSIMSYFGMVALAGIVVNDAIVLINHLNSLIGGGEPFFDALWKAGARRFMAVFLTTITTVGGMSTLIFGRDIQAQFLIPMAITVSAGLIFATLLTLLFIPCLLGILNDMRRAAHYLATGRWPTPEEVEPAWIESKEVDEESSPQFVEPVGVT